MVNGPQGWGCRFYLTSRYEPVPSLPKSRPTQTDMDMKWIFMNNQIVYMDSAVQGACIGIALAFTVLLLATWLPLVALFATLSIICTLISVIGGMVMLGWELGSIESILISITAGFRYEWVKSRPRNVAIMMAA